MHASVVRVGEGGAHGRPRDEQRVADETAAPHGETRREARVAADPGAHRVDDALLPHARRQQHDDALALVRREPRGEAHEEVVEQPRGDVGGEQALVPVGARDGGGEPVERGAVRLHDDARVAVLPLDLRGERLVLAERDAGGGRDGLLAREVRRLGDRAREGLEDRQLQVGDGPEEAEGVGREVVHAHGRRRGSTLRLAAGPDPGRLDRRRPASEHLEHVASV